MLSILNSPGDSDSEPDITGDMPFLLTTEAHQLLIDALLAHAKEVHTKHEDDQPELVRQEPKTRKEDS